MSNANQHLTPDAIDRIPFPLDAGYRIVSRPAKNSVVIAPRKVGALYTDDDFKKLAAYGKPFGFTVMRHGEKQGYAYVIAPLDRPYDWLGAFFSDGGAAEAARKQRAQEEAEEKRREEAQKEEEYRSLPSSTWIDENLGTEFTSLHNRLMLARVLDGVDKKFRGLIDRFWLSPLESIGFDPEQHGSDNAAVIAFLKRKYAEQAKPKQEKADPFAGNKLFSIPSAALSPGLVVRTDGTPFKTEAAARQAMKNRRMQGYEPVAVEGGFALAPVVAQEAQAAGSEAASQAPKAPQAAAGDGPAATDGNARPAPAALLIEAANKKQAEETGENTAVTEPSHGDVPHFETYDDAIDWIERRAKDLGMSRRAFSSTDEYKAIYPQIEALYQDQKAKTAERRMAALRDAGLAVGDRVQTTAPGMFLDGTDYSGTIVLRGGEPWVKVDGKITVSRNGRLREASTVRWDSRWKKQTATDAEH